MSPLLTADVWSSSHTFELQAAAVLLLLLQHGSNVSHETMDSLYCGDHQHMVERCAGARGSGRRS